MSSSSIVLGGAGTEHPVTCRRSMEMGSRLYIMETFWDRQRFETASYCLGADQPLFYGNGQRQQQDVLFR